MSGRLARIGGRLGLLLLVGLIAGWAVFLRPLSLGGSDLYLVVRGDSMLPTYQTGDLVVLRARPSYSVGEIVAYRVPDGELGAGHVIIHRIAGGDPVHGFVMQGDHNPSPDPWRPRASDVEGAAWILVPGVGRTLATLHHPVVLGSLAAALVVAWFVAAGVGRGRDEVQPRPA